MSQDKSISRKQLVSIFFIALLLFILFHVFFILSPFLSPMFWAAVLAFGFYPFYKKLKQKFKFSDNTAAGIMTFLIFLLFVPLVIFLVISLFEEGVRFYHWILDWIEQGHFELLVARFHGLTIIQKIEGAIHQIEPDGAKQSSNTWLVSQAYALVQMAGQQAGAFTKNLFLFIFKFFLTFFLVFFFLRDGQKIVDFIHEITPLEEKNKNEIFRRLDETFEAVLHGQILTALAQSILAGVAFWLLGLPLPILLAGVTFVTAMVPIFGAATVWVPMTAYLAFQGEFTKAVILFLIGLLGISLVDNILKPFLIGEKAKLPYFLLFLGILGGLQVYGLMGIFLAPAVLSIFFVLIKIYREKFVA